MDVMALYEIEGLELDSVLRSKPVYTMVNKLRDILRNRMFQSNLPYKYAFNKYPDFLTDSISELFTEPFWTYGYMDMTEDCTEDSWNQCSGFTYDITTFAMIARVASCAGKDILSLSLEDFEEMLPEIYSCEDFEGDWYNEADREQDEEEDEDLQYSLLAEDCMGFVCELKQCQEKTAFETARSEGAVLLKDFSSKIFLGMLTPYQVLQNFDTIAAVSFGVYDGYNRTLCTFGSQKLAKVLNAESLLQDMEEFKQLKSCLLYLENPMNCDFEPIVIHNEDYWSVTVLETDNSNIYATRPFLKELVEQIEQLTISLLDCLPNN